MRGHAPTQPSSSRPPSVHGCWVQPCTASSCSGAPGPFALAAASGLKRASEMVEEVANRRALLAANAAVVVIGAVVCSVDCMCVGLSVGMYVCISVCLSVCLPAYMSACKAARLYVCLYVGMDAGMYA